MSDIYERIEEQLAASRIVLYMKGTKDFPQCGFSGLAVQILSQCGADYVAYNILEDEELRQGIKDFGQWPTIPQLYVDGQLVGGSDIMREMYESGELQPLLTAAASAE